MNPSSEHFNNTKLLDSIDEILSLSSHYKKILDLHLSVLVNCETVVDLACGTGILVLELLKKSKNVFAIDLSSESLSKLNKKAQELNLTKNLTLMKQDATNLEALQDNSFDAVSSMIAAHLFTDFKRHLEESFRILRKGGIFVITARSNQKNQEHLVDVVKDSLEKKGIYSEYKERFKYLRNNLLLTAKTRSKHLLSPNEVKKLLYSIGFRNVEIRENGTSGVMYTFIAKKP